MVGVHPVDEDHARLCVGVGRLHDLVPEIASPDRSLGDRLAATVLEVEPPVSIVRDSLHERVGDEHGQVEHAELGRVALGVDEGFDVRVIAAHGSHHCTAPGACRHHGPAHGIPDVHEGQRTAGIRRNTLHLCSLGPDRAEVVADPAALLHGQGGLLQVGEDALHRVGDRAHREAVRERHVAASPSPRDDPSGRAEVALLHDVVEPLGVGLRGLLTRSQRVGDAPPRIADGLIDRRAVVVLHAVLLVPDELRDGWERRHGVLMW